MRQYYRLFYPHRLLFQWLNQGVTPTTKFTHREFAFTLENGGYLRYQSFSNAEAFRDKLLALNPSRFEIGPVYTEDPQKRNVVGKAAFRPLEKELVFDIDLTDYDDIRTCCQDKDICEKCWKFVTVAIKVIDRALRQDFGFKHILWVYSGRRGAHAWVCDKRALKLDDSRRKSILGYLQYVKKGSNSGSVFKYPRLHPHIEQSLKIVANEFSDIVLLEQDAWATSARAEKFLSMIYDRVLVSKLREYWASDSLFQSETNYSSNKKTMSQNRWDSLDKASSLSKDINTKNVVNIKKDIILSSLYPRLDSEVSKHLNHLLKAPFCVHPSTGNVCVPIDFETLEEFNPMTVPKVGQLLTELERYKDDGDMDEDMKGNESAADTQRKKRLTATEKTSLEPYVKIFKSFVNDLLSEALHEKRMREEATPSFEF